MTSSSQNSSLGQLPISRVDQVLVSIGKGRSGFSFQLVAFVPSDHHAQTRGSPDGVFRSNEPPRVTRRAPKGGTAPPGWSIKAIHEAIKGVGKVAGYLDDVIRFDSDLSAHGKTMRAFFERLRKHDTKLSPPRARLGATGADFQEHSVSPGGVRPNAKKVSPLTLTPHAHASRPEAPLLPSG